MSWMSPLPLSNVLFPVSGKKSPEPKLPMVLLMPVSVLVPAAVLMVLVPLKNIPFEFWAVLAPV